MTTWFAGGDSAFAAQRCRSSGMKSICLARHGDLAIEIAPEQMQEQILRQCRCGTA